MLHIILFEPEIPQNTGALIRLSANSGIYLHLIKPYAFDLSEKKVRRAGLDYQELAHVYEHDSLQDCLNDVSFNRVYALTTKTQRYYSEAKFEDGDAILFGPETRGLPAEVIESLPEAQRLTIPMQPNSRSLNLANAVSIVAYEAWRQLDFNMNLTE